jgi:Ni/Co efflux regulator RcnB
MRMGTILLAGVAAMLGTGATLQAAAPGKIRIASPAAKHGAWRVHPGGHRWGPRHQGRWFAGWYAPGGWAAYRRPVVGYVLPSYWIAPRYRISDYGAYGLPAPMAGYGWSRYYDDAVMVDSQGRVRDHRSGVDWDERGHDAPPPGVDYDDDVAGGDGPPPPPHEYEGRWTGTWRDENGRSYSGEYEGRFEGEARSRYGADYDAPPYAAAPHVEHHGGAGAPVVTTTHAPGYFAGGYYYPGATTTTVVLQPAVTTTTSYVTEVVPARRHKVRRSCNCK